MPLSKIQGINGQVVPNLGRRNILINGAMQIAQRGTSSSSFGLHTVDRFSHVSSRDQFVATQEQSTDVPTGQGYTKSFKITTTTPETTIDGVNYNAIRYIFEAQDLQHLCWGTSAAKSLSVSFWVKSSVTGTYVTSNYFYDPNRNITVPYTINSANTWEYKTIVIPGDTGGTINNDNGSGLAIQFVLSVGPDYQGTVSTSWGSYVNARWGNGQTAQMMNVNGATWAITGLQVEVGSTPTEFEHRSAGEELALCQRYFQIYGGYGTEHIQNGVMSTNRINVTKTFPVVMRTGPTFSGTLYGGAWSHWRIYSTTDGSPDVTGSSESYPSPRTHSFSLTHGSSTTAGNAGHAYIVNAAGRLSFDAEL